MYHNKILPKVRQQGILHSIMLELTYKCNLDCFFCYNDRQLPGQLLRIKEYEKMLDDLKEMQVLFLTLTGGEPILHPDFFAIGRAAVERGFVIRIKSGGHAIAGKIARKIKQQINPFELQISLHGACAETHEKQTQVKGSFDRLIENIRYMKEIGLRPTFISTLTLWNENELPAMYELADELGVRLTFQGPVGPKDDGDTEPLTIQPTADGWLKLERIHNARPSSDLEVYERDDSSDNTADIQNYCGLGTEQVIVDPYGTVYPCMHVRSSAGNLHDISIKDIWDGGDASTFSKARELSRSASARKKENNALGVLDTPMYCPGLELRGCGSSSNAGGCGTGCGSSKGVNQTLQETGLPNIRSL